jgi:hypothetical protein
LNIRADLKKSREWLYHAAKVPAIYFKIDDNHMLHVQFESYSITSFGNKNKASRMVVRMLNSDKPRHYDDAIIFEKKIPQFSKDFFLVRKLRNILLNKYISIEESMKEEEKRVMGEEYLKSY